MAASSSDQSLSLSLSSSTPETTTTTEQIFAPTIAELPESAKGSDKDSDKDGSGSSSDGYSCSGAGSSGISSAFSSAASAYGSESGAGCGAPGGSAASLTFSKGPGPGCAESKAKIEDHETIKGQVMQEIQNARKMLGDEIAKILGFLTGKVLSNIEYRRLGQELLSTRGEVNDATANLIVHTIPVPGNIQDASWETLKGHTVDFNQDDIATDGKERDELRIFRTVLGTLRNDIRQKIIGTIQKVPQYEEGFTNLQSMEIYLGLVELAKMLPAALDSFKAFYPPLASTVVSVSAAADSDSVGCGAGSSPSKP